MSFFLEEDLNDGYYILMLKQKKSICVIYIKKPLEFR